MKGKGSVIIWNKKYQISEKLFLSLFFRFEKLEFLDPSDLSKKFIIISIKNTIIKGSRKKDNLRIEVGIVRYFIFVKKSLNPTIFEPSIKANLFEELLKASNIIAEKDNK